MFVKNGNERNTWLANKIILNLNLKWDFLVFNVRVTSSYRNSSNYTRVLFSYLWHNDTTEPIYHLYTVVITTIKMEPM